MDYFTKDGVILRTGFSNKRDWYLLCIRELIDNGVDFLVRIYKGAKGMTITTEIFKDDNLFHLKVKNSNDSNFEVFKNKKGIFDYEQRYGSKQDLHVISRGILGDAMKQLLAFAYILIHLHDDGSSFEDKQWEEPLIIRHNKKEYKIYLKVDKARQTAIIRKEESSAELTNPSTEIEFTLPTPDELRSDLDRDCIEEFCRKYPLFTTDITFKFEITDNSSSEDLQSKSDDEPVSNSQEVLAKKLLKAISSESPRATIKIEYEQLHAISAESWNKQNSIHSYTPEEFKRRFVNMDPKQAPDVRIYDLLQTYREGSNLRKTSEHKISVADLLALPEQKRNKKIETFYNQLKAALSPPEKLVLPYTTNKEERKSTLIARLRRLYKNLDINNDKASYKGIHARYEDENISFPYFFEILAVPFDDPRSADINIVFIGAVNYSISPKENSNLFEGDYSKYIYDVDTYSKTKDILGILNAYGFHDYANDTAKIPCLIIANLVTPKREPHGQDKSRIDITPFAGTIVQGIKVEQRRSIIQKLNTSGHSQRQIAKIIGISLGVVNRELKFLNGRSVQSVQLFGKLNTCKLKVELQKPKPQFQDFKEQVPELKNLASFDCEWYREDIPKNKESGLAGKIYCFCLIDTKGHKVKLHLEDFAGHENRFMSAILDAIEPYDALVGYAILAKKKDYVTGSIDGDIEQLRKNCDKLEQVLKTRFEAIEQRIKFLDLHSIFSCNSTKAFLTAAENVTYRGETLHDVATAYLKEGKLENLKGSEIESLSPNVQAEYCLQDARLSLRLAEKDDYRLLKIFYNISKEIGQDFYSTCNFAKPTSWWRSKLKPLNYQKVEGETARWQADHIIKDDNDRPKKGVHYTGGKVFEPIVGLHKDVITYDVASMYPTMGNVHNISSETINCICCKDGPDAKIPNDVMELINSDLIKDGHEPRPWHYWICRKRRGILSSIMEELIQKKSEYKKQGLSLEEKAVKLFANSGYGTFGQVHFEYYDFRVAELITGFARHTLLRLEQLLKDGGLQILYGDTDSLFVRNVDNIHGTNNGGDINCVNGYGAADITTIAKERFGVDFSKDKTWKILVLLNNKKQYFGILENDEVSYKKLVGLKNNYPPYFNDIVLNLINKETIELFSLSTNARYQNNKEAKEHVSNYLRSVFNILDDNLLVGDMKFVAQKLFYSAKTQKALYEHRRNCWQKYIFDEKVEDCNGDRALAEMSSGAKSIHSFWKIIPSGRADNKSCTTHAERYTLDVDTYKKELWNCIEPIIQAYGFSNAECIKLRNELVNNQTEL